MWGERRRLPVKRALLSAAFVLLLFITGATASYADDGSGMRCPDPYIEQIYGDTAR
jgi:hypothetical protein